MSFANGNTIYYTAGTSTITTSGTNWVNYQGSPAPRPAPESEVDWLKRRVREITDLVSV